ncbi:DNA primase [Clostridium sp. SYSU_GA19001]|uniref:DNA primase n=1 Tax=Clostridium caldaquaticum TaxID=2940653 RepID=UPI0020778F05|nr:DNA primase [Clostridium caldaquaticum]
MISEEIIQKIKESNDIVDIISESVKLKRSGRNYAGLCPFHQEKTPSFSVSQEKQIFKCFGCGEAGNVITFVMKYKNLDFIEAVKLLAERANIQLEDENSEGIKNRDINEKLFRLNVDAARYFFSQLKNNKSAMSYFLGRGISEATIRKFGLGYAPDSWNNLMNFLKRKGYTELDMLNVGLIIKSQKDSFYDRFRNRVMFPVFDHRGKVIGFGGRVLDDSKPKYLNSPESNIFKKGINLYGLNFAINNLKDRMLIIVEGYLDCISLHQQGITNVVASLGTALTTNQAKLLKRYADRIIISYDADAAGQNATLRGLEILKNEGFDVRVLTVPQGKDPDEFIRSNGREEFIKLINKALPLIDYKIKKIGEGTNFNDPEMLARYVKNAALILTDLNPLQKDVYIKKIAEETGIKEQAIYDLISGEIQKNVNKSGNINTVDNFGQKLYLEPAYIKAERSILKLMNMRKEAYDYVIKNFSEDMMIMESHRKIYRLINEYIDFEFNERQKLVELKCDDIDSSREWISLLELELLYENDDFIKFIDDCFKEIKKYKLEEAMKDIRKKIKFYEEKGQFEDSLKLTQDMVNIQNELARL